MLSYGRGGESSLPPRDVPTWSRVYFHCQGSPTNCPLAALLVFIKLRGRKASVQRFNRIGGNGGSTYGCWEILTTDQWYSWAPES